MLPAIALLGVAAAQNLGPDEVTAHTSPYIPPSNVTLRAQVDLVEVPVVVRDAARRSVKGLSQADFEVYDAGEKQAISSFVVETFASQGHAAGNPSHTDPSGADAADSSQTGTSPRVLVICLDDLNSDAGALKRAKSAAERFVQTNLAPGDQVAILTTASPRKAALTHDASILIKRIEEVKTHQRVFEDGPQQCLRIGSYEAYQIASHVDPTVLPAKVDQYLACLQARNPPPRANVETLVTVTAQSIWDRALNNSRKTLQALESEVEALGQLPGRRVLLLASVGFLSGDLENELDQLSTKALRAGVVINTLDARGLFTPMEEAADSRPVGWMRTGQAGAMVPGGRQEQAKDETLAVLAAATGGSHFHNNNDFDRGFRELGMAPEIVYVLGFHPSNRKEDGGYRNLKVKLAAKTPYSVQARLGYAAPSAHAPSQSSRLDHEVLASGAIADLPVRFEWESGKLKTGEPGVTAVFHVDLSKLKFQLSPDRRMQKLTIVAAVFDAAGNFITGKRSDVGLNLTDASFTSLTHLGDFRGTIPLPAPPGTYTVRSLVEDGIESRMSAQSQAVRIP